MYSKFVQVIINNNSKSTDNVYTYGVPDELISDIAVGKRVEVSFSRTKNTLDGLIVKITNNTEVQIEKIKAIISVIDKDVIIKPELVRLASWIREKYICKYSDVIRLMVPTQIKFDCAKDGEMRLIRVISLVDKEKKIDEYKLKSNAIKQKEIIEYLKKFGKVTLQELQKNFNSATSIVKVMAEKGIVTIEKSLYDLRGSNEVDGCKKINILNEEQQKCYEEIIDSNNIAFLLHGITGSGKTEIYIKLIDYYVKQGKQSIMLVPEISLTNQIVDRFRRAFGDRIAVFHSKLTVKQRYIQWMKVFNEEVDVVIGARSALFSPIKNLGIIIIDEEHEESYKSSTSPKYDAIEVGLKRGYIEGAKVLLGSATPSLRTYNMVENGYVKLLELKKRAKSATLPHINIIDMKIEVENGNDTIVSMPLFRSMKASLKKKEQVILFVNRRGYSNFISCKKCGYVVKCDKCDVSMTYHLNKNQLRCHYCGKVKPSFSVCPQCGSDKIQQYGFGTQQAEEVISRIFRNYVVARMDLDSMANKDDYENTYKDFRDGKIDILVGTQMLAKGLDFPNVTTVGILSADSIINLPFYNASEKAFQLLTQVSGRAGRGEKQGYVFIQTYEPENFIINTAKENDYAQFIFEESRLRKEFFYPPFINIINVCTISRNEAELNKYSMEKYEELKKNIQDSIKENGVLLYRPTPHSIYRVNNEYRINLYMKTSIKYTKILRDIIRSVYMDKDVNNIKISININTENV